MKTLKFLGILMLTVVAIGCAATQKAASQPKAKDLSVLDPGTSRDLVILELGAPAESRTENGKTLIFFPLCKAILRKLMLHGSLAMPLVKS